MSLVWPSRRWVLCCLALFGPSSTLNQFNSTQYPSPGLSPPLHLHNPDVSFPHSPPPQDQRHCINTPAPLAMDSPQTSSANDIFSLSDQTLANRLQFIEEVRKGPCCTDPAVSLTPRVFALCRLATGIGEASGDVVQNPTLRPNHHRTSMRRSSSPLNSCIGPRRKLLRPESARCKRSGRFD